MQLTEGAKTELKIILEKEIGFESIEMLGDKDINHIGVLLLSIFSEALKMKSYG
jgi:hypothetical protein